MKKWVWTHRILLDKSDLLPRFTVSDKIFITSDFRMSANSGTVKLFVADVVHRTYLSLHST